MDPWTIFWLCNIPPYLYTAYRVAGQFAWHEKNSWSWNRDKLRPDGSDIAMGWVLGLFVAFVWPLTLLISLGMSTGFMLYTPKDEKMKMYQQRIKQLEREVGVG